MATTTVLDSTGTPVTVQLPNANGRAAAASSGPVALSNEDKTSLDAVTTKLNAGINVTIVGGQLGETLWVNDAGTYAVRTDVAGTITWYTPAGAVDSTFGASAGVRPSGDAATVVKDTYVVTTAATGYSVGDLLDHIVAVDRKTAAIVSNIWLNSTAGTILGSAPVSGNISTMLVASQPISAASLPLPTGAATEATLASQSAKLPASLGAKTGAASLSVVPNSDTKFPTTQADGDNAALGAKADAAWASGAGSLIAIAKALVAAAQTSVPDRASTGTLDNTLLNNAVSASVLGTATAVFEIGTAATALGGATVVTFELQRSVGGAWNSTFGYPASGYRVRSTGVGGVYSVDIEGCVGVRVRVSTVGTGTSVVALNLTAMPRLQGVVPASVGQTTRSYADASGLFLTTSGSDQATGAISANEIMIHARAAAWFNINAAATKGAGSFCLEAGERFHRQITPGDILHYLQDTATGTVVVTPVA